MHLWPLKLADRTQWKTFKKNYVNHQMDGKLVSTPTCEVTAAAEPQSTSGMKKILLHRRFDLLNGTEHTEHETHVGKLVDLFSFPLWVHTRKGAQPGVQKDRGRQRGDRKERDRDRQGREQEKADTQAFPLLGLTLPPARLVRGKNTGVGSLPFSRESSQANDGTWVSCTA